MKLLLIGLDGLRVDVALPEATAADPRFAEPDHPGDPRFAAPPREAGPPPGPEQDGEVLAPTLRRLLASGGRIVPVWMTPPTDSGPGWASLLTGTTHEQNGVWWNELVGHRLARCPDVLTRVWSAAPAARTLAACTWPALVDAGGPGPVIQQRPDQQLGGQHQLFAADDFSRGCASADRQVTARAAWVLNREGPDAAFVHLEGADEAGHRSGADSADYRDAVSAVDEHVRHLVKAVSERWERLGERWLVAVTTDHGHRAEGGHGDDEPEVRRSFLLLHEIGHRPAAGPTEPSGLAGRGLPDVLSSHEVVPLLLHLLGVVSGSWSPEHEVGDRRDVPDLGPTRDPAHEW